MRGPGGQKANRVTGDGSLEASEACPMRWKQRPAEHRESGSCGQGSNGLLRDRETVRIMANFEFFIASGYYFRFGETSN